MIAEAQVISNGGWNLIYLFVGAGVGIIGAVLMMVWEEVRDERETNEDGGRGDDGGEGGRR